MKPCSVKVHGDLNIIMQIHIALSLKGGLEYPWPVKFELFAVNNQRGWKETCCPAWVGMRGLFQAGGFLCLAPPRLSWVYSLFSDECESGARRPG